MMPGRTCIFYNFWNPLSSYESLSKTEALTFCIWCNVVVNSWIDLLYGLPLCPGAPVQVSLYPTQLPSQVAAHHINGTGHSDVHLPVLRIRVVYPGSWFLFIPDPGSKNSNKREGWKKICCPTFFCSHKYHKIENYFDFQLAHKKIRANLQRIIELFTPKNCH